MEKEPQFSDENKKLSGRWAAVFTAAFIIILLFSAKTVLANPETGNVGLLNCRVYATENMSLMSEPGSGRIVRTITAGQRMTFVSQTARGSIYYWEVTFTKNDVTYTGYVVRSKCFVNIGDYDPNIQVNITNAVQSLFMTQAYSSSQGYSSYITLTGITYTNLYGDDWEPDEAPVTYAFARRLSAANTALMKAGYTLKIYDSYRPYSVSLQLHEALSEAYTSVSGISECITKYGFSLSWFASANRSAHNSGTAVDATLVNLSTGEEADMPTQMHLLSSSAAIRTNNSSDGTYISDSKTRKTLTAISVGAGTAAQKENAVLFNNYMTGAALYSLKSEWWHFQFSEDNGDMAYNWKIIS